MHLLLAATYQPILICHIYFLIISLKLLTQVNPMLRPACRISIMLPFGLWFANRQTLEEVDWRLVIQNHPLLTDLNPLSRVRRVGYNLEVCVKGFGWFRSDLKGPVCGFERPSAVALCRCMTL